MENYFAGMKLTENQRTKNLVDWLNASQHYLEDIDEGSYRYVIAKTPELPIEFKKENLRELRETKCFAVINRGQIWYDRLTESQKEELSAWYDAWLKVTETFVEPKMPEWLK